MNLLNLLGILLVIETILLIVFIILYACSPTKTIIVHNETTKENVLDIQPQALFSNKIGFGMFDHILFINLDHRLDRRWQIETELHKMGVPDHKITRIPGVYEKIGALGCSKAHLNALELFEKNTTWSNVLIMEDDAMFAQSRESIDYMLNRFCSLNIHWDVLKLLANVQQFKETDFDFLLRIIESQTTAGYAINRHYLPILKQNLMESIELFTKKPSGDFCIDQYWKPLQKTGTWFTFHPTIGYQRDGFSNIENRFTDYPDKYALLPTRKANMFIVAIKTFKANLHKNKKQLENLEILSKQNIDWFYYWGDPNLETEFSFDALNRVLTVKSKDDYLNLCDKFGKMVRFLRNLLSIQTSVFGVLFTDDDVNLRIDNFFEFLNANRDIKYWGKTVHLTSNRTLHIAHKCEENKSVANLVDENYPLLRLIPFEIPSNMDYCPGGGFYLSRSTIPKLLLREDLFLNFPQPQQLQFHEQIENNEKFFKNVCVIDDVNIALALSSFQIFPEHKNIQEIVEWENMN